MIGTAGPGNHAYLRQLGAIPVAYCDGLVGAVRAHAAVGTGHGRGKVVLIVEP